MYRQAAELIVNAKRVTAFTGAGISVESGIPPFRGESGLWNRYDPALFEINYFMSNPEECWGMIKELFYDIFGEVRPNLAHYALHEMEMNGHLSAIVTQNIDNLHHEAGSRNVYEFHGNSRKLVCLNCRRKARVGETDLGVLPPSCGRCGGLLKPDFVFFGEPIPEAAEKGAAREAERSDVIIVIGTTGTVKPACHIPFIAKESGASVIEVNTEPSAYTRRITDIFLKGRATDEMEMLTETLYSAG